MTNENNRREKDVINKRYTYTEIFSILTVFVSASGVIYIRIWIATIKRKDMEQNFSDW